MPSDLDPFGDAVDEVLSHIDEEPEPGELIDDRKAAGLLRALARATAERDRVKQVAASEIEAIRSWEADRIFGPARAIDWLERSLEGFARMVHQRTGKKSTALPLGRPALREAQPSVEVVDADAFRAWVNECREDEAFLLLETPPAPPPSPDKDEIKARVKDGRYKQAEKPAGDVELDDRGRAAFDVADENGEIIPGVRIRRHPTGFTFSTGLKAAAQTEGE